MSTKNKQFDIYERVYFDHNTLVLDYHQAESAFRNLFFTKDRKSDLEFKRLNQKRRECFQKIVEFENRIGKTAISEAYKYTGKINYLDHPKLSPYSKSSTGRQKDLEQSKSVVQEYFLSFKGSNFNFELDESQLPLYLQIKMMAGDDKTLLFNFILAGNLNKEKQPEILMFALWSFPKTIIQEKMPQINDPEDHSYAQPLSKQPVDPLAIEAMLDWIFTDLTENYFGSPVTNTFELKNQVKEKVTKIRPNIGLLRQKFPEISAFL